MTIEQSVSIEASAAKVYNALTSADQFSGATGAPAEIATDEGGAFLMFGGEISGRHIELIPGQRIVQVSLPFIHPDNVFKRLGEGTHGAARQHA